MVKVRPKLKNTLPFTDSDFKVGSVGRKNVLFFSSIMPQKGRSVKTTCLYIYVICINYIYLFNIPLFQHVTLTSKYIECTKHEKMYKDVVFLTFVTKMNFVTIHLCVCKHAYKNEESKPTINIRLIIKLKVKTAIAQIRKDAE